jgi:hypothetical protein
VRQRVGQIHRLRPRGPTATARRAAVVAGVALGVLLSSSCTAADITAVQFDVAGNPGAVDCGTWISRVAVFDAQTGRRIWEVEAVSRRRGVDDVGEVHLGVLPSRRWREVSPFSPAPRPASWRFDVWSGFARPTTITVPGRGEVGTVYTSAGRQSVRHFHDQTCAGLALSPMAVLGFVGLLLGGALLAIGLAVSRTREVRRRDQEALAALARRHPPAWHPDPWRPERWIWWSGSQWFEPRPAPVTRNRVSADAASRAGLLAIRARPRLSSGIGAVMLGCVGILYVGTTFGNGWVFGYDFFTEAAPSETADTVAVVSLVVLSVLVAAVCAWSFGAFAAAALGESTVGASYRRSGRRLRRDWVFAVPAFLLAVVALMSVLLGPLVVGMLATIAVGRVANTARGSTAPRLARGIVLGIIPTALSVVVWTIGAITADRASPPTWLAMVFFVGLVSAATVAMAWLAAANAAIVIGESPQPHAVATETTSEGASARFQGAVVLPDHADG